MTTDQTAERTGYEKAIAVLLGVAQRTGSPAAKWAAEYLAVDPDKQGPPPGEPTGPFAYETTKAIKKHLRILGYSYPSVEWDGALAAARAFAEQAETPARCTRELDVERGHVSRPELTFDHVMVYVSEQTNQRRPGVRLVCTCGWGIVAVHADQARPLAQIIAEATAHAEVCR